MYNPLVSIIIPLYNAENYIAQTIQSALNQTWPNKEIIVIDDGSTDNSLSIAKTFENDILKVYSQPNKGASAARNYGLREAKGDYIQFLDADDLLNTNKIEKQVILLKGFPSHLATSNTIHFFDNDNLNDLKPNPYEEQYWLNSDNPIDYLIKLWGGFDGKGSMISIHSWLTPRKIIDYAGLWDERLTLNDDGEFFTRVILNSTGVLHCTEAINYYRKHINQQSLSGSKSLNNLNSLLWSAISKKEQILSRTDQKEAYLAIYRLLYDVAFFSYPKYPKLTKLAENHFPKINFRYQPIIGGRLITFIANKISWKLARHLQIMSLNLFKIR